MSSMSITRMTGERVKICTLRKDDEAAKQYMKWLNDDDILWRINANASILDNVTTYFWLTGPIPKDIKLFNIVTCGSDELIGILELKSKYGSQSGTIAICIGEKEHYNRGLGSEALNLGIKHAFEDMQFHRLEVKCIEQNKHALRCFEKVGFKQCGLLRQDTWIKGEWRNIVMMELLASDYFKDHSIDDIEED